MLLYQTAHSLLQQYHLMISLFLLVHVSLAIELNLNDSDSINSALETISKGIVSYYGGNDIGSPIGMFRAPYYWWEAGGAWGSLIDYWWYTGDDQYNDLIKTALLAQVGENWDYVPMNQSMVEGNDDQAFWGIAVMAAVEKNFTNPKEDEPQWLYLAQAVFNTMSDRWDDGHCGGGLRWQIFQWNSGYDYKNSVSNGALFHMAARLARYTGNQTYIDWAEKIWDWMIDVKFIAGGNTFLSVYDGAQIEGNCTNVVPIQWSYNIGLMLSGTAYLYNHTVDPIWEERLNKLLVGTNVFFNQSIMYEVACQAHLVCNNDQRSFKAYLSRFLGLTATLVEGTRPTIDSYLRTSAVAAAQTCVGGTDKVTCGLNWQRFGWDGQYGLGEEMSALEVIQNVRYKDMPPPYTAETGGSSQGHPEAGLNTGTEDGVTSLSIRKRDKVGASVITAFAGTSTVGLTTFLLT